VSPSPITIPVIDISGAVDGRSMGRAAALIDDACRSVGFFQIVGHGIDPALLDAVYATAPDLWGLPSDVKWRYHSPEYHAFQGWYTMDDPHGVPLQEKWEIIRFDSPADAIAHGVPERYADHFRPNLWPDAAPRFVDATRACFAATRAVGHRVMALFAVALGLPPGWFDDALCLDASYFAVNSYPGRSTEPPGTVCIPEHADSGTLTLLHQRGNYEGLEVKLRSGDRIAVPVIDEAVLVNIGELMVRWTGGRWVATRHRVVTGEPGTSRTSITTFHTPSVDAVITPVPTVTPVEGIDCTPVTVYEWEPRFLLRSFAPTSTSPGRRD
jgi:isopenicillin N synthase-like dioxygenase